MANRIEQRSSDIRPGQAGNLSREAGTTPDELDNETDVERVEILASGADRTGDIDEDDVSEQLSELAASTDEEVDALEINLRQDDEPPSSRDSSGRVVDDVAAAASTVGYELLCAVTPRVPFVTTEVGSVDIEL